MESSDPSWSGSFFRIVKGTFRPNGRAVRSDLVIYGATVIVVNLIVSFIAGLTLTFESAALVKDIFALLVLIPVPALLVRRLQDSGKRATWLWLGFPAIGLWIARSAVVLQWGTDSSVEFGKMTWPFDWLAILSNIALLALLALPGTIGSNRFGDDPRGRLPVTRAD